MRLTEHASNDFRLINADSFPPEEGAYGPSGEGLDSLNPLDPICRQRSTRLTPGHTLRRHEENMAMPDKRTRALRWAREFPARLRTRRTS